MPKTKTAPAVATQPDAYASKKHKFYTEAWIVDALDAYAKAMDSNRSQILTRLAKRYLRVNSPKMKKAGIKLPAELFKK